MNRPQSVNAATGASRNWAEGERLTKRLEQLGIPPKVSPYYLRWAETWMKALGHQSAERNRAWFEALGRSPNLSDWQFRQAVDAARILAHDVLALSWAAVFDWNGLLDQAVNLPPDHRTLARETIRVPALVGELPPPEQAAQLNEAQELELTLPLLRRAIRLAKLAVATEQTYLYWNARYLRYCHRKLGRPARLASPDGAESYLNFLALERNVAPATQKQALNAMVFLLKRVFGIEEFQFDITRAREYRRPPVVLTRDEVRSIFAHLEEPWKLIAQIMYGSGLRLMEAMRLRVKDVDFGQGTIAIHDGKGGKHRVVPLPKAIEAKLNAYLVAQHTKHLKDLEGGAGEVHLPESFLRKSPGAARQWCWQWLFPSAVLCPHPHTGKIARYHLHDGSMA
ncbi:MAG TPA: phage integrase N-terminal SAM-like domain-containing protein, partial [Luteolibacter sp.]|nr:phage integrase N-terminal SAM-like domain-containing protein [Luteolibacter sp.]